MRAGRVERVVLLVGSLGVMGWLGVGVRDARLQSAGQALAERPPSALSAGDAARADRLLREARFWNPDTDPDLLRAGMLALQGRVGTARPLAESIVRREPQNARAWGLVALTARRGDPARAAQADAAVARLSPLVPGGG